MFDGLFLNLLSISRINKKLRVYIATTYKTLIEERLIAGGSILEAGHIPVGLGVPTTLSNNTSFASVYNTDVYLLILGGQFGFLHNKSDTKTEFMEALVYSKVIITIILDESNVSQIVDLQDLENYINVGKKYFDFSMFSSFIMIVTNKAELRESIINFLHFVSLININSRSDIIKHLRHYHETYRKSSIESLKSITINKCIIDHSYLQIQSDYLAYLRYIKLLCFEKYQYCKDSLNSF